MGKKKTPIEQVMNNYRDRNLTLDDPNSYAGALVKMKCTCFSGHKIGISPSRVQQGHGCPECFRIRKRKPLEEVRELFEENNIVVHDINTYKDNKTPMKCTCPEGHETAISVSNLRRGRKGCPICANNVKYTSEEADAQYKFYGFTMCNPGDYINNRTPHKCICPEGHVTFIRLDDLQKGRGCGECYISTRKTGPEADVIYRNNGFTMHDIDSYVNVTTKNKCTCPNGHIVEISLNHIHQKRGCPMCVNKTEAKGFEYVSLKHEAKNQFKSEFCPGKRFDIVIEDLKIIIEIDGDQHFRQVSNWESPEFNLTNDVYKMKCMLEHGYRIIRIYQPDMVKNDNWKPLLDEAILSEEKVIYISSKPEIYDKHKNELVDFFSCGIV